GSSRDKNTIVYIGRIVPQKDLKTLIKAFSIVVKKHDVRLRIIGEGNEKKELETLARKLGIEKNITFTGRIENHNDIVKEMKSATLLVLPSKKECFGIVPLEAMACNLPVISTKTEGPRDYMKNYYNGFLTEIGNEKELAKRIIEILEDEKLYKKIQINGRKTAEGYDWDIIIKRIADVYRGMV
ncbi:glycosyltransferase, partial [Candidatus Aenigmatarchaeota archaeon]